MMLTDYLDDFARAAPVSAVSEPEEGNAADPVADSLASFEDGYKAGWDDAVKAQNDDSRHVSTDLAQNLQDLSFTYNEAVGHVVRSIAPILTQMVDLVLPELARQSLGLQIVEQLESATRDSASPPVEILVAEENLTAVSGLLEQDFGFPVRLRAGQGMHSGQADILFGTQETQIDLAEVLSGISDLVQGFLYENEKVVNHG